MEWTNTFANTVVVILYQLYLIVLIIVALIIVMLFFRPVLVNKIFIFGKPLKFVSIYKND